MNDKSTFRIIRKIGKPSFRSYFDPHKSSFLQYVLIDFNNYYSEDLIKLCRCLPVCWVTAYNKPFIIT